MGKGIKNSELVRRTGKIAFYLVPGHSAYTRMEGFTSLSTSKSTTTYERQYVDEDFKRTDTTGYNTAISYALDRHKGNAVIDDIIKIHEDELLGQDAVRSIIQVDMTTAQNTTGRNWKANAKMRDYAVVPSSDGDSTDCLTYAGDFKTKGDMEDVEAYTSDDFQTVYITGTDEKPVLTTLSLSVGTLSPSFTSKTTSYTTAQTGSITLLASAESDTYSITAMCKGVSQSMNGKSASFSNLADGDYIYIIVDNGSGTANASRTYTVRIAASA